MRGLAVAMGGTQNASAGPAASRALARTSFIGAGPLARGVEGRMPPSTGPLLLRIGRMHLERCRPFLAAVDPHGTVSPPSRLLCAGLAALGLEAYRALGGRRHVTDVGTAAAMLSLLTKIDDQVIDSAAFHGGASSEPDAVAARVRLHLAPTLASIRARTPATAEPRCRLAAELGERLQALCGEPERLKHLHSVLSRGWEIQAQAVSTLCSHPGMVSQRRVARVTRDISGAWLLMITLVGTLPRDAARPLGVAEEENFFEWGQYIQQADALADLDKDTQEGLVCSVPGRLAYRHDPQAFLTATACGDRHALYGLYARSGADLACLPEAGRRRSLLAPLASLGGVGALLEWIHGLLLWRYLQHRDCRRSARHPKVWPLLHDQRGWRCFLRASANAGGACSGP